MHFTRTPLKNKKPVNYGTNKMGQYYSNIRVPIKNYSSTPIAKRIDKNMTNLSVSDQPTNKNLNQFIQTVIEPVVLEPETDLNIFNYNYDNKNVNEGPAEKTKKFEEDYEEMKIIFNKNLNVDDNLFNYKSNTEINMDVWLAEKTIKIEEMKITFNKNVNVDDNLFNYKSNTEINMDMNVELTEKIELTLNNDDISHLNIFNYDYDNINVNVGLAEKFQEINLSLNKDLIVDSTVNSNIDVFNYKSNTEINMNVNVQEIEKIELPINNNDRNTQMNLQTDDKNFNSFLSVLIEPSKTMNDTDDAFINKPYTETHITSILNMLQLTNVTIENVYQETYGSDIKATGLGDFIRGSYFLMQFCEEKQLLYNINMLNHPISQFLEIYQNKQSLHYKNINKFDLTNFNPNILDDNILTNIYDYTINNDFIYFLKDQTAHNKTIYTYLISYPTIIIDEEHKKYMQHLLKPTKWLSLLVDEQLTKLDLYGKEYNIIHIRYGDDYLIKNEFDIKFSHLNIIKQTINNLDSTNKILLISDNMIIKTCVTNMFPNIKTHFNEITHTGEGVQIDTNKLKNTMIDFYLFSRAKNVHAFSVYKHGTGFSKWAAETYSVPYICRFLQ